MIQDPFGIFLALAASVFLAVWLERNYRFFRSLSAGLLCLLFGMVLSNTGFLVGEAESYEQISNIWINAAIVLVLLNVDLRAVLGAGKAMLAAFGLGALGTMLGTFLGTLLLAGELGAEAWKLTGQFTGTYIGGSANFYALAAAFETDPNLMSAALAADVIVTSIWLAACIAIPALLRGGRSLDPVPSGKGPLTLEQQLNESGESLRMMDFFGLGAITLGTMVTAQLIAGVVPGIPSVLWLTTITLVLGHTGPVRNAAGGAGARELAALPVSRRERGALAHLRNVRRRADALPLRGDRGGGPRARHLWGRTALAYGRRDPRGGVPGEHRGRRLRGGDRLGPGLRRQAAARDRGGARRLRDRELLRVRHGDPGADAARGLARIPHTSGAEIDAGWFSSRREPNQP